MDWLDYREKLNIGFNNEDKVKHFMVKIFNKMNRIVISNDYIIGENEYYSYCNMTGTQANNGGMYGIGLHCILESFSDYRNNIKEFIAHYVAFINCIGVEYADDNRKESFKSILTSGLDESHIPFDIYEDETGFFIIPKGAKELDDALVSDVLHWMKDYPKSRKTYTNALKQYTDGIYIRDVADNFRKTLEEFYQEFLGNDKNLANNKTLICKKLSDKNVNPNIGGFYQDIINKYDTLNNVVAKHHDYVDKSILEFLLYQTGLLIRMVIVVLGGNKLD